MWKILLPKLCLNSLNQFFSFLSLKPQVTQGKQEVTVSFAKESGKKIIDPGNDLDFFVLFSK